MKIVKVKLFASLRDFGPKKLQVGESFSVEISENSNIEDLLIKLNIPMEYAKIIMVNRNIVKDYTQFLESNDEVSIFPPVGGGRT